jgi:flagellar assembly protein FliH
MTTTKFIFEPIFDAEREPASDASRGRRRRTLTEAELEGLCAEARAEGFSSAEARALEDIAVATNEAAISVLKVLTQLNAERNALREQAADLAFAFARKLAHAALAQFPHADVEAALREAMHQAIGEPRIVLKAAPHVAEAIAPRLAEIAHEEAFDGRVQVSPDASLSRADCRIEWRGGGAERAETVIEKALQDLIARSFKDAALTTSDGADHGQQ